MTRASLLRILDNLGGISEPEIQELEQLAAAFPYCQTAHLLLAKAAHDRGSMLAAQRLRRAATYAVDRQRLRTLIELPAPLPPPQLAAPADATRVETAPMLPEIAPQSAPIGTATEATAEVELVEAPDSSNSELKTLDSQPLAELTPAAESGSPEMPPNPSVEVAVAEPELTVLSAVSEEVVPATPSTPANAPQLDAAVTFAEEVPQDAATSAASTSTEQADSEPIILDETSLQPEVVAVVVPATLLIEEDPATKTVTDEDGKTDELATPAANEEVTRAELAPTASNSAPAGDELPPEVPLIRPPAEVGSSRFEFGLAEPLPGALSNYNLFDVEKPPVKSTVIIPSFWADEEVGYAPGLGSRLGFCLQAQDEYTLDLPPSAFFAPDALLLHHLKQHQPVPPPVPKSIDLIDKFLRSKPRFKAPLPLPPTTEAQADLSVQSTIAEPGLASESLARILARQGKIAKAIQIYERLMVRQPEKKAYFADQIQQLQTFE